METRAARRAMTSAARSGRRRAMGAATARQTALWGRTRGYRFEKRAPGPQRAIWIGSMKLPELSRLQILCGGSAVRCSPPTWIRSRTVLAVSAAKCGTAPRQNERSWSEKPHPFCSGKSPGIHRPAYLAGKANLRGARVLAEDRAPASSSAEVTRRAVRSLVPRMVSTSPRSSCP